MRSLGGCALKLFRLVLLSMASARTSTPTARTSFATARRVHCSHANFFSSLRHTKPLSASPPRNCLDEPIQIYDTRFFVSNATLRTRRARCLWCCNSASPTIVSEVALTIVLTDTYITLMTQINHSMSLSLTRSESVDLTTIITPRQRSLLCLLLLVRLGDYIVNSCDFYSYRLIGKLTTFLQFQEFNNTTVDSSTSATRLALPNSSPGLTWLSLRLQLYVLCLI